jgi:ABC-type antimicrobial peptide transport system permease subunit
VGVAADTREYGLAQDATHTLYRSSAQTFPGQSIVIRTAGDISGVIQHVRTTVSQLDAERPVDNVATLENLRFEDLAAPRLNATLFSAFAALALVIASVGVLGVLGFSVTQRTREFGVRMALGARKEQVLRMVMREGGIMLVVALVAGAAASLLLTRFLGDILFQIGSADPITYLTVTLVLSAVTALAAYLPARRATRVQPAEALRSE